MKCDPILTGSLRERHREMVESLLQIKKQRTRSHVSPWPSSKTWLAQGCKTSNLDSKIPSIHIFEAPTVRDKNLLCHFIKQLENINMQKQWIRDS